MYIRFKNLVGQEVCVEARKVKQVDGYLRFTCSNKYGTINISIEDLISVSVVPDLPRVAFIPDYIFNKERGKFEGIECYWYNDYLYCLFKDCGSMQKIIKELVKEYEEVMMVELPIEDYEYNNK